MRKWIVGVLAALVLALGGVLFSQGTAQAVWGCSLNYNSYSAWSYCEGGLGGHRAVGYCWNGSYDEGPYYGPWASAGHTSKMICGGGKLLDGAWIEYW
jgi:hypothetical protein